MSSILAYEDDPGVPGESRRLVRRPVPTRLGSGRLPIRITARPQPPGEYQPGSRPFRYWAVAEALRRGIDFWGPMLPRTARWYRRDGASAPLRVYIHNKGDFNAYYNRRGLKFYDSDLDGIRASTTESPDTVCHELGHALLDSLRPQLWRIASGEVGAFHEAFGDISSILCALQLRSLRESVIDETGGHLSRSSRLSRVMEQMGWWQGRWVPDSADAGCLRNAVNSLYYREPETLPAYAPAPVLCSDAHSYSRVFSAGFYQVLVKMFESGDVQGQSQLRTVSRHAGKMIVHAIWNAPIVPTYFSQVAVHMVEADRRLFGGKYRDALIGGFTMGGLLSHDAVNALDTYRPAWPQRAFGRLPTERQWPEDEPVAAARFGLGNRLYVRPASQPVRFNLFGAARGTGMVEPRGHAEAAAAFVEDLFRQGRVEAAPNLERPPIGIDGFPRLKTHRVVDVRGRLTLKRKLFACHGR